MTNNQRIRAFALLQGMVKDGQLPHGALTKVAKVFGVTRATIANLWKQAGVSQAGPLVKSPDVKRAKNQGGRPSKYNMEDVRAAVRCVPLRKRKCVRDLSEQTGLPRSTLHRIMYKYRCDKMVDDDRRSQISLQEQ